MVLPGPGPLPAVPTVSLGLLTYTPIFFGTQLFSGRFSAVTYSGFNPNYELAIGDMVLLRLWGAVTYEAPQPVDPQGNIFVPNVGPIHVQGVRNSDLNQQVETLVKRVFKANVGVYATLQAAQPVKVYVTGFVRAPGLYPGLSSDSVLYYIDRASGIDPDRGSFLGVDVMRNNKLRAHIDLYKFLLTGQIDQIQLQDGDTIVVSQRQYAVAVNGEVLNPYMFELPGGKMNAADLLKYAQPTPYATNISIIRADGPERRSEYYPLSQASKITIEAGDAVTITADKFPATIQVRINGAQLGERTLVLPYGAKLKDVIARLHPAPFADMNSLQLFRASVALSQKASLDQQLRSLQIAALSGRSASAEEAALRQTEAAMLTQFIAQSQSVVPKGQVVLNPKAQSAEMLMEDQDTLNIPTKSNLIDVSGEVMLPNTVVYKPGARIDDYVAVVGGYTQKADRSGIIVMHPDGSVAPEDSTPQPGDKIMVLPKVQTKWVAIAASISAILYQLAISAGVLNNLGL
jgi:protein involved in polysaccharide export with SLBB domain